MTSVGLFKGKVIALFALPGAFTPTCSSTRLPRFRLAALLLLAGICPQRRRASPVTPWTALADASNCRILVEAEPVAAVSAKPQVADAGVR